MKAKESRNINLPYFRSFRCEADMPHAQRQPPKGQCYCLLHPPVIGSPAWIWFTTATLAPVGHNKVPYGRGWRGKGCDNMFQSTINRVTIQVVF
jgi:hypothetical protein